MRTVAVALTFLAVTVSSPVFSQQTSEDVPALFVIQATLYDGDRIIGTPKMTLREHAPGIITATTDRGYSLHLAISEEPLDARYGPRVRVRGEVHLRRGSSWAHVASPQLITPLDQIATFQIASTARSDRQTDEPFRIELRVSRSEANISRLNLRASPCSARRVAVWRAVMANNLQLPERRLATLAQGNCCQSSCLTCCGEPGTCCWETTACLGSCCVG